MTDAILALVPVWGPGLVAVATFLSCLALPVPSSLVMLAAGGFAAAGDLALWQVAGAAFAGAVLGDQAGYRIGRAGGRLAGGRAGSARGRQSLARAAASLRRHGAAAVFLSRWLFSPLGPYVNFAAGAGEMPHGRFTVAGVAGEAVWVALYVGLGAVFADDLVALADLLGSASGLLAALAVAGLLALWLRAALRQRARTG
jgi:membrane protein DedA with SNARE-associated domain